MSQKTAAALLDSQAVFRGQDVFFLKYGLLDFLDTPDTPNRSQTG